jgi:streptogramin lyase
MMATRWLCGILNRLTKVNKLACALSGGWARGLVLMLLLGNVFIAAAQTVPNAASVAPAAKPAPAQVVSAPASKTESPDAAHSWQLVATIKLPNPGLASLDRRGTLYVADAGNNVRQFGRDGQPLNTYAPTQPGHVAQLEAWNLTQTLLFYDDRQQLVLLDRFMAPISTVRLADYLPDGTVRTATLAPDGRVWLLDESTLALRTLDPQTGLLPQTTPLDLIIGRSRPDFRFLRHYQNNLYLVDRTSGIFVFDNLGNYQKKLPFPGLNFVGFSGDELYFFDNAGLHFFDLYKLRERQQLLPATVEMSTVRQVLLSEQYAYIVTSSGIAIYQL